jgi:serine/threonine protein kinase/tetratricopeptide (TPR) repeat protein
MPVDPAVAKSLFLELAAVDESGTRAAMLRDRCGDDAELFARVGALLAANDRAVLGGDEEPGANAEGSLDRDERIGAVLGGRYKLVELVGEGGMGCVFMAQQTEPVIRAVAVKVIKAGMDSRAVLARFEAERQALALMDHPNIARVLDAGTTDSGRPFFVMELVKGVPITRYCDERTLTPRQRLELFVPVCHAIQHAHQKGVIHRDIKPSNVLVATYDDRPVPKVIDFGVAKAAGPALTDDVVLTAFGALIGTPEYMSPEQAGLNNLDVDTRSDVYSLGALLFELLTGTTPVDRKSLRNAAMLEVLRVVREVEAPRPSEKLSAIDTLPNVAAHRGTEPAKLGKLLKGELDWVVLKALEKDRTRRYETADGLARDIQRYLSDEVVEARPPSAGYRLRKFVRRNARTVMAAIALTVLLLAGVAGTAWQAWRATLAERSAKENERQAVAQKERAQANFQLAKDAVDKYLNAVTDNPKLKEKDFLKLRKELLETAVPFYRKFVEEKNGDRESEADRGRAFNRLAVVRDALGEKAAALADTEAMLAVFARLTDEFPDVPAYRQELAKSHNNRGNLLYALGKFDEAEAAYRIALKIKGQLADEFPDAPTYRWEFARSHNNLGLLLKDLGRLDEAETAFRKALGIQVPLAPKLPGDPARRHDLASSHNNLAILLKAQKRYAEAETAHAVAQDLYRQLATDFPAVPAYRNDLASSHNNVANLLSAQGKREEAVTAYRAALVLQQRLVEDFPSVPEYREDLARSHTNLAPLLKRLGRNDEAESANRTAIKLLERLVTDDSGVVIYALELGRSYKDLGVTMKDKGEPQAALEWQGKAIDVLGALLKREPRLTKVRECLGNAHWARADAMDALHHYDDAVRDWDRAIELSEPSQKAKFEGRKRQSLELAARQRNAGN